MRESSKYLIDSNIIIYHLNGEEIATNFLKRNLFCSSISRLTFIEVLSFDFSEDEKNNVVALLNKFQILDTNETIAQNALSNRKIKKIKLADNIIASTAQNNNLILVTRNTKDFTNLELDTLDIFQA